MASLCILLVAVCHHLPSLTCHPANFELATSAPHSIVVRPGGWLVTMRVDGSAPVSTAAIGTPRARRCGAGPHRAAVGSESWSGRHSPDEESCICYILCVQLGASAVLLLSVPSPPPLPNGAARRERRRREPTRVVRRRPRRDRARLCRHCAGVVAGRCGLPRLARLCRGGALKAPPRRWA
eukprot:254943-Chlamydomonas_euryale.AAC.4